MDITLRMSDHALTARAAAAAGIVLLQNKNRTLPLLPQEEGAPPRCPRRMARRCPSPCSASNSCKPPPLTKP